MRLIIFLALMACALQHFGQDLSDPEDLYSQTSELFDNAQYKKVIEIAQARLDKGPYDVAYVLQSKAYLEMEEYGLALKSLEDALVYFPESSPLLMEHGGLMLMYGQFDVAIDSYNKAEQFSKHDSILQGVLASRGGAYSIIREFDKAYADLTRALEMDSNSIAVLMNLGAVADEAGHSEDALGYFFRILEIDPDEYGAYGNIGFAYQEQGEYQKAIDYFDKVLEHEPEDGLSWSNKAYCYYHLDQLKEARACAKKSIKYYPMNSYVYRTVALIDIKEGKIEDACEQLDQALALGFLRMYGEEASQLKEKYCSK